MSPASRGRRGGFALLPVVLALSLVGATAYLMTRAGASGVALVASAQQTDRARYVAEAALRHAIWQVQASNCSGFGDVATKSFGASSYSATVEPDSGSPIAVKAVGTLADGTSHELVRTGERAYETPSVAVLQLGSDPGEDTLLDSFYTDRNYGGVSYLRVNSASDWIQRPLIRFDLSSLPAGVEVISARLELKQWSVVAPGVVSVHRVARDWVEGTKSGGGIADGATWPTFDGTQTWAVPGGDFDRTPASEARVSNATNGQWMGWELAELVEGWLADPASNHGMLLRGEAALRQAEFASRDTNNPADAPRLTVVYACECGVGAGSISEVDQPGNGGQDTYIFDGSPSTNFSTDTEIRLSNKINSKKRGLLKFKLEGLPPDANVTSATLQMNLLGIGSGGVASVDVHRVTTGWAAGSATWNSATGATPWITPGGDWDSTVEDTAVIDAAAPGPTTWDLTALLSGWLDGTYANEGVILIGSADVNHADFSTSEDANPALRPKLTVVYACECGKVCGAAASPVPLLLVVSDASSPTSEESAGMALMESWGYAVTPISAAASQEEYDTALADVDVAYIAGSISSNDLGTKLTDATVGVLSEDAGLVDELGIAEPLFTSRNTQDIEIIDNTHYVTSALSIGDLAIFSSPQAVWTVGGALAPGLQILGETKVSGTGYPPGVAVLETGAALYGGGFAAGRRVQVPWSIGSAFDYSALTADGLDIMKRAIEWAAGASCGGTTPLLLVVSDAVAPTLQDAARETLLASWCYAVTRIDDDATSGELAAALSLNDVVYVSLEITTLEVVAKLRNATIGVVNEHGDLIDDFGMASGSPTAVTLTNASIIDNVHYITDSFPLGDLTLVSPWQPFTYVNAGVAAGVQVLADVFNKPSLLVADTGAELLGSTPAPGRRVQLPWGSDGFDINALNIDGLKLMQRALEWAAGAGCGSLQDVLLVVGDDTLPLASHDAGRVELIESGCFRVSTIDDGETQTNFNTAIEAADVVFASGTSSGPTLLDKLTGADRGVVNEVNGKLDNFGFSSSTGSTLTADSFAETDAAHYISEPFGGESVTVLTTALSLPVPGGTLAPGLLVPAGVSSTDEAVVTLETGAQRWDGGSAPARRVHLPFANADTTQMTADGQTLLLRAVEWAAGASDGGGGEPPGSSVVFEEFSEGFRPAPGGESVSIPKPAGTTVGDLLIAAVATDGNTASTLAPNGSWNPTQLDLGHNGNGSVTFGVWWKIADGTESEDLVYSWTGSEDAYGWIMRFTGHDPSSPIATAATSTGDATDPLSTNLITGADGMLILRLGGFDDDDITVDAPGLPEHTAITMDRSGTGVQNTVSGGAGYAAQATAGDTGTSNFELTKREQYRSVTLAIRPAP